MRDIFIIKKKIKLQVAANVAAGTGLGSSGSFTTRLIKAVYYFQNQSIGHYELAEKACQIEIDDLKRNVESKINSPLFMAE